MQRTIYQCDECEKEIGDKLHIHMDLRSNIRVGIAMEQHNDGVWGLHLKLKQAIYHFCNSVCLQRFFSKMMKEAKAKKGNLKRRK